MMLALSRQTFVKAFVGRPQVFGGRRSASSVAYRLQTEETTSSTAAPLATQKSFLWDDMNNNKNPIVKKNGFQKKTNGAVEQPISNGYHINGNNNIINSDGLSVAELAQRIEGTHDVKHSDLSRVEFVASEEYHAIPKLSEVALDPIDDTDDHYPFAAMLQGSAPYIASHLGETVVFYIPGEWLHKPNKLFDSFLQDVSLARLMGMKIVLVADCRMEADAGCLQEGFEYAHECHNSVRVTSAAAIRQIEEEAGFIRFEVERKLNRLMRRTLVSGTADEGNVLGGNFYTARAFGNVRGVDLEHTGFAQHVYTDNIKHALDNNDVVLLTTVGWSKNGDSVSVNGHHLAATVAASLDAYKLIYMSNQGSVLSQKGQESQQFFQEVPLSFVKELTDFHNVRVHKTGFATFEHARKSLEPRAVELLLNLAWGAYALEQGVTRAHVVNPKDGALLEELFTSKNGANTCLYHDDENADDEDDVNWLSEEDAEDWNTFFEEAAAQKQQIGGSDRCITELAAFDDE